MQAVTANKLYGSIISERFCDTLIPDRPSVSIRKIVPAGIYSKSAMETLECVIKEKTL